MKHPVWILNSALAILLVFAFGFMFFSRKKPAAREDIEPSGTFSPLKGEVVKVNIHNIYENDLFGTYKKEFPTYVPGSIAPMPTPPVAKQVSVPPLPKPQFLDPLNITLKGIIIIMDDDSKNRAIIADNTTNKETIYSVGQTIQDGQLIRILSNKVIILRSNGQQEVLYLREKDAKMDPAYNSQSDWLDVVRKISDTEFEINPREFVSRVNNLAQFIDMLDLITVYKQGKSIGCRIGSPINTLGSELGLQTTDVIVSINDTPATTTAERFKIYKEIIAMQNNNIINVKVLRQDQEITLKFILKNFTQSVDQTSKPTTASTGALTDQTQTPANASSTAPTVTVQRESSSEQIREQQLRSLEQQHTFAPTLKDIRAKERENMLRKGKSSDATMINDKVE